MCPHNPTCPDAGSEQAAQARVVADHDVTQGWQLLCNGLVRFHDNSTVALAPTG